MRPKRPNEPKPVLIFAAIVALFVFSLGVVMAFVIWPRQETEWRHIQGLPGLDRDGYVATPAGDLVVVTGVLRDNRTMTRDELVAYRVDEWDVRRDKDGEYEGKWLTLEESVPALAIAVPGGTVKTAADSSPTLDGEVHEFLQLSNSSLRVSYRGRELPDGSRRTQGVRNGDLVTVVGHKATTGDLQSDRLFAGDRAHLLDHLRFGAQGVLAVGVVLMVVGLLVLVISVGWGAFVRRGRLFRRLGAGRSAGADRAR